MLNVLSCPLSECLYFSVAHIGAGDKAEEW